MNSSSPDFLLRTASSHSVLFALLYAGSKDRKARRYNHNPCHCPLLDNAIYFTSSEFLKNNHI